MKSFRIVAALAAIVVMPLLAPAQDLPKATKLEKVTWYYSVAVRFKNGKADEARKLIQQYFVPADKAVGVEVLAFTCQSGRWDSIFFLPMRDGIADLMWKVSPGNEQWFAALAKVAGGAKQAMEVVAKWDDLVADWDRTLVYR
jgi:hypothetical protein